MAGKFPAFSLGVQIMRELSIFVDESGDFGSFEPHAPYYIFTLVFHDQKTSIQGQLLRLEAALRHMGYEEDHCFHVGPIIRREEDYAFLTVEERRSCLNKLVAFVKSVPISFASFCVEKKMITDAVGLTVALTRQLSGFLQNNLSFFSNYDRIIVYYDNGQVELNKVLASVFTVLLSNVEFRKVYPAEYRLFQAADLICTMELIERKMQKKSLSKSEQLFFGTLRDLKKNYLKPIERMRFHEI